MDLLSEGFVGKVPVAVGMELRIARRRHHWTMKQMIQELSLELTEQTVATYELGTRTLGVARFVELCQGLEEQPDMLLRRALARMSDFPQAVIPVDLTLLRRTAHARLFALRRWAEVRAEQLAEQGRTTTEYLTSESLSLLAHLAGLDDLELVRALREAGVATENRLPPAREH